jgi:hypothetical protein
VLAVDVRRRPLALLDEVDPPGVLRLEDRDPLPHAVPLAAAALRRVEPVAWRKRRRRAKDGK